MSKAVSSRPWPLTTLVALVLAGAVAVVGFRHAGTWLVVDGRVSRVDVLVLLGGNPNVRVPRAAEAYHQGVADRIVVTTPGSDGREGLGMVPDESKRARWILGHLGVPDSSIVVVSDTVWSTADEAKAIVSRLDQFGSRIGLVTSAAHTRRALCAFRREAGHRAQVFAIPVYDPGYELGRWWATRQGRITVLTEWSKTLYHLGC